MAKKKLSGVLCEAARKMLNILEAERMVDEHGFTFEAPPLSVDEREALQELLTEIYTQNPRHRPRKNSFRDTIITCMVEIELQKNTTKDKLDACTTVAAEMSESYDIELTATRIVQIYDDYKHHPMPIDIRNNPEIVLKGQQVAEGWQPLWALLLPAKTKTN